MDEDGWVRVVNASTTCTTTMSASPGASRHTIRRETVGALNGSNEVGGKNNDTPVGETEDDGSGLGSGPGSGSPKQMVFKWGIADTGAGAGAGTGAVVTRTIHASPTNPMSVSKNVTVDHVRARYDVIEQRFRSTLFHERVRDILATRVLPPSSSTSSSSCHNTDETSREGCKVRIKTCVLFGSGSLSGDAVHWIDRRESALYQVSCFLAVVDTITRLQGGSRPRCIAQEPGYNAVDVDVLKGLGVSVVVHPEGFEALRTTASKSEGEGERPANTDVMVYSPAAEMEVEYQILSSRPAVWLHRGLDHLLLSMREGNFTPSESEVNSRITRDFKDGYDFSKLPEVEARNFPFHGSVIWWRKKGLGDTRD